MKKHFVETAGFLKLKCSIRNYFKTLCDGKGGGRWEGKYGVFNEKGESKIQ